MRTPEQQAFKDTWDAQRKIEGLVSQIDFDSPRGEEAYDLLLRVHCHLDMILWPNIYQKWEGK